MISCSKKELEFSVFIINKLSNYLKKPVDEVYRILKESKLLEEYIIECYDVLHTLGCEYLMEDITDAIRERGFAYKEVILEQKVKDVLHTLYGR